MFGSDKIPEVLATLIRTCLIAAPKHRLVVADLSAIEARVTAWLAKCEWRLNVFRTHGMIYEASASQMFKIPFEEFKGYKKRTGKHHPARKKGKVSELALGYQGSVNAMIQMGALDMGLTFDELQPMVDAWRLANPEIAGVIGEDGWPEGGLWRDVEGAAKRCVKTGRRQETAGCIFRKAGGNLVITLPSGRHLHYVRAHMRLNGNKWSIAYWGVDQKTKRWGLIFTYGGKLVENWTQAWARDVFAERMEDIEAAGYDPLIGIHDEWITETPDTEEFSGEKLAGVMARPVEWATNVPLAAAGLDCYRYRKD